MSYISTSNAIWSVDFHGQCAHFIFNNELETLGKLIAEHGKYGIVKIKQYVPHKGTFKTMSKKEVQSWFDWDTYTIEQLKKINYIK